MRLKPENLKVGSTFYECQYGINLKFTVTVEPYSIDGKIQWEALSENDKPTNFMITVGYENYGPKIYSEPVYTMKDFRTLKESTIG